MAKKRFTPNKKKFLETHEQIVAQFSELEKQIKKTQQKKFSDETLTYSAQASNLSLMKQYAKDLETPDISKRITKYELAQQELTLSTLKLATQLAQERIELESKAKQIGAQDRAEAKRAKRREEERQKRAAKKEQEKQEKERKIEELKEKSEEYKNKPFTEPVKYQNPEKEYADYFTDWTEIPAEEAGEDYPYARDEIVENLRSILSVSINENVSSFLLALLDQEIQKDEQGLLDRLTLYGDYPLDLAGNVTYESNTPFVVQEASKLSFLITGSNEYNKTIEELGATDDYERRQARKSVGGGFRSINFLDKKADYEKI